MAQSKEKCSGLREVGVSMPSEQGTCDLSPATLLVDPRGSGTSSRASAAAGSVPGRALARPRRDVPTRCACGRLLKRCRLRGVRAVPAGRSS
jgi:hypothetical protein